MAVWAGGPTGLLARLPRAEGQVGLEAENRADLLGLRRLVEGPGCVQVAVVGDGQAVHAEPLDLCDQLFDAVGTVEQRVFAVGVEMDESHNGGLLLPQLQLPPDPVQRHAASMQQHQ